MRSRPAARRERSSSLGEDVTQSQEGSPMTRPIAPGAWLGLLGGGQLGRMFCMAAQSMGYRVVVLDPGSVSPAGTVADMHIRRDYLDPQGLEELARLAQGVTTEFENVPAKALEFLAGHCWVSPMAASVAIAQDRIREKQFITGAGIGVAPHLVVRNAADLDSVDAGLLPGILKVSRLGYDGKGQARVATFDQAQAAFRAFGEVPCVLEKLLPLKSEISVVVARARDASVVTYAVSENEHKGGILDTSIVPARISAPLADAARSAALRIGAAGRRRAQCRLAYRVCARLCRRPVRRILRAGRRHAAGQRTGAAPAQQRALQHRRMRHQPVRTAGAGVGRAAAGRHAPAHAGGDVERSGRKLDRSACGRGA